MIDWDRVSELRYELGAEGFREVAELFLEEVESLLARVPDRIDRREDDMHFLKGSAWNLGFEALASLCQDGERCAARGDGASVDVPAICKTWEESRTQFLEGIGPGWGAAA
ncbi:Hpt domain-containing protein [Frigidibacter sp. MR17.24]|uniref:Hpt domain-containing protein n=1 Tax=Frigidibacter sp. MR17.24 TaxID=3127345 RepID=UPI003012EEC1